MRCDELKLFLLMEGQCSGDEEKEIKEHLAGCKRCEKKYEQMKFTVNCFTSYYEKTQRVECPAADEIVSYQEGELYGKRLKKIEEHIADCGPCREELLLLQESDAHANLGAERIIHPPPLSKEVLDEVAKLGRKNLREKMERVVRALVEKGKGAISPERINEAIDKYLFPAGAEPLPVHALPSAAAKFDTELTLNETAICDITLNIQGYEISIQAVDDVLTVRVTRDGEGVSDVEVSFMTRYLGARKTTTGKDGVGIIAGIRQAPYQVSIRVPDDHEE